MRYSISRGASGSKYPSHFAKRRDAGRTYAPIIGQCPVASGTKSYPAESKILFDGVGHPWTTLREWFLTVSCTITGRASEYCKAIEDIDAALLLAGAGIGAPTAAAFGFIAGVLFTSKP
jgi:hypothetical protein